VKHPVPTHSEYLATRHFGSLDGFRFLCISAVIWHHTPFWTDLSHTSVFFTRGHVGVDFFFVLSGYLITTLLFREESAKGRFNLREFYWRRALRIVPIFYFVVTLAAFVEIGLNGKTSSWEILPFYYLFLSNFISVEHINYLDPTWSLAVEEQYYLIWPLLLALVPRRWIVPILIGLIAINVTAAMGLFTLVGITAIETPLLRFALDGATYAPILLGSLAAVLLHNAAGFARIAPLLQAKLAPLICLGLLCFALAVTPRALEGLPNLIVHSLMTLTLISLVVREDNGLAWVLKLPPLVRIGQISYGIYLYHLFAKAVVIAVFIRFELSNPVLYILLLYALAILFAEISFRTIEAWFLQFRHRPPGQTPGAQPDI